MAHGPISTLLRQYKAYLPVGESTTSAAPLLGREGQSTTVMGMAPILQLGRVVTKEWESISMGYTRIMSIPT